MKTIEFWFDFGSNYSYLSMMRIDALALAAGARVVYKPFALGAIFKSFGWDNSPFVLQTLKGAYTWRDMERQCEKCGLPWRKPSTFPRRALLPMRLACLAQDEPWLPAFCQRVMSRNFADDAEIDGEAVVLEALAPLSGDAAQWIARAQSDEGKSRLRENTDQALRRGVFGAPTFFVDGEMYWGNDRLDDAIAALGASR